MSGARDRKSTRLNSSHTEIYTLSLHDALPILLERVASVRVEGYGQPIALTCSIGVATSDMLNVWGERSEEHTSELQSHRDLHSFPTRRSSDLTGTRCQRQSGGLRAAHCADMQHRRRHQRHAECLGR